MSRAVVLFSGGQDSTTCLYWAKERFASVQALSFEYGQRHGTELAAGATIAQLADVNRTVVDVPSFQQVSRTALVDDDQPIVEYDDTLPTSFLHGRNIVFLAIAGGYAAERDIDNLVVGVSEQDYAGYPDCQAGFIAAMQKALSEGLDADIGIHAPLLTKSKAETVELARELSGCWEAMAHTVTCYNGIKGGCGECPACKYRTKGFREAGYEDPAKCAAST